MREARTLSCAPRAHRPNSPTRIAPHKKSDALACFTTYFVRSEARKAFGSRLTYSYIGIYILLMARASTTSDAFNAVAEPRRREILEYLAGGERAVGDVVVRLGIEQPSVSKHLKVLRQVGLVRVRRHGRQMFYQANASAIRPLYEWTKTFERLWAHQLLRVKERAEQKARETEDR